MQKNSQLVALVRSHDMDGALRDIFNASPLLESVCIDIANYVGDRFLSSTGDSLVLTTIGEAMAAYSAANESGGFEDSREVVVDADIEFVTALLKVGKRLLGQSLVAPENAAGESEIWVPYAESASDFVERNVGATWHQVPSPQDSILDETSAMLAFGARVLSANYLSAVCHQVTRSASLVTA